MLNRVLIVDDEPLARERVAELVRVMAPGAVVREVADGEAAIGAVRAWSPDVVFLDVQMPGPDGFEVLEAIGVDKMPPTIFVTAFDRHAIHAFDVAAVDYLLKPFDEERFRAAWQRAEANQGLRTLRAESARLAALLTAIAGGEAPPTQPPAAPQQWTDRVVVTRDQRTIVVNLADVQWIESSGNYVVLHAGREKHSLRETLTGFESRLDPRRFVRIHRQTIVAVDALKEIQPWFGGDQVMILKDGTQLRVSRNYRERLGKQLAQTG